MKRKYTYLLVTIIALLLTGCAENKERAEVPADAVIIEETQIETSIAADDTADTKQPEIIVEGNKGTITIGTIGAPYDELLTQAKILLAKEGWDVQIKTYTDFELLNQDVLNGTLDAHMFSHRTYMDSYNEVHHSQLIAVAPVCYEKYGIYSVLNEDLTKITTGITIGIPAEDTKKARALLFLEDLGYLSLKEEVGLTAIIEDVVENPYNIQFMEYTAETACDILRQADYCVMGADGAILAGLEPHKEVLKEETPQMRSAQSMAAWLVTTQEKAENEKLLILIEALQSKNMQEYVKETYKEAVGLFDGL